MPTYSANILTVFGFCKYSFKFFIIYGVMRLFYLYLNYPWDND